MEIIQSLQSYKVIRLIIFNTIINMEKFEKYKEEFKKNNPELSDEFIEKYFELRKYLWT